VISEWRLLDYTVSWKWLVSLHLHYDPCHRR